MTRVGWLASAASVLALAAAVLTWAASSDDTAGPVASGATLFQAKGCAGCHPGPDSSPRYTDYPSLVNAAAWAGDRREGVDARDYLTQSIRTPGVFVSPAWTGDGPPMPDLGLADHEIDALVDYLLQG